MIVTRVRRKYFEGNSSCLYTTSPELPIVSCILLRSAEGVFWEPLSTYHGIADGGDVDVDVDVGTCLKGVRS